MAIALACAAAAACARPFAAPRAPADLAYAHRWWIFLGHSAQIEQADWRAAAEGVDLVIFNDDPRLAPAQLSAATTRLAYLSIGEAEMERWYWHKVSGKSYVVETNPEWTRSVRVDIRDQRWRDLLLEEEVPRLLAQGYQGFMLDTLDTVLYLERREPERFAGSRKALRNFLQTLQTRFPRAILLANGTDALAEAAPYVDGFVTEGLFATYDAATHHYRETTFAERAWRLGRVHAALARAPRPVFSIEYALDAGLASWAVGESLRYGFRPYVTTKNIDKIPAPPD